MAVSENALLELGEIDPSEFASWVLDWPKHMWQELENEPGHYAIPRLESSPRLHMLECAAISYCAYLSRLIQAYVPRVVPGQTIAEHIDILGERVRRFHIPLTTNPHAEFIVDGDYRHMKVGKIYEVNPKFPHRIYNGGVTDRIHLMIDIEEPE